MLAYIPSMVAQSPNLPNGLSPDETRQILEIYQADTDFQDSEEFSKRNVRAKLFETEVDMTEAELTWHRLLVHYERDTELSHRASSRDFILSAEEERLVFLQMNYAKKVVTRLKKRRNLTLEAAREMLVWYQIAKQRENTLTVSNLGLINAVGDRYNVFSRQDKQEIVSEMHEGLLNAIRKFSVDRGFKFSTYAWHAIARRATRVITKNANRYSRFLTTDFPEGHEAVDTRGHKTFYADDVEHLQHALFNNSANLTKLEQEILAHRFGFSETRKTLTLEEVGKLVGVTKERIRQVQNQALRKLKEQLTN